MAVHIHRAELQVSRNARCLGAARLLIALLFVGSCTGETKPPLSPPPVVEPPTRPQRADATPPGIEPPPPAGVDASAPDAAAPPVGTPGADAAPVMNDAAPPANAAEDPFGVRKIYPTKNAGREWYLPGDASRGDGEWGGANAVTRTDEAGVWHLEGSPRIQVSSPAGKAWWRNVEMTAYYRYRSTLPNADLTPGFQLYARGERHTANPVDGASINQSRPPPPGTPTWPGYPFTGMINAHCLGSSYKGYLDINGSMDFKKEISHTAGYTGSRDSKKPFGGTVPANQWLGFKVMIRNFAGDRSVHLESWLDPRGDGNWQKVNEVRDTGGWTGAANPDGCGAPPFSYADDQIITWAGPYVNWRFDFVSVDLKWLSAREIDPLP